MSADEAAALAEAAAAYDPQDDGSVAQDEAPSEDQRRIDAVRQALAPAHRMAAVAGPVHHSELAAVLRIIEQALLSLINGPEAVVDTGGESLDMAGDQKRGGEAYRAHLEQARADGHDPLTLAQFNERNNAQPEAGADLSAAQVEEREDLKDQGVDVDETTREDTQPGTGEPVTSKDLLGA